MPNEGLFVGMPLDGNRRYARKYNLGTTTEGHRAGGNAFKKIVERARDEGRVRILAAWALSCKNLENRSPMEIDNIFCISRDFLADLRDNWMDREENHNVRLLHMGRRDRMAKHDMGSEVLDLLDEIAEDTHERAALVVALCFDYSGDNEQNRAMCAWKAAGTPGDRGDEFRNYLDLPRQGVEYRQTDLIIRTGKEEGESDRDGAFLHPYVAGGETRLRSSTLLFPEFTPDDFSAELDAFQKEAKRQGR